MVPSWEPKWSKNRYKRGWKNDEKMMMARMAKKMDISGYEGKGNPCPEPRGGGRGSAKPLLQYSKKHWMKELGDGCWHASPKPPDAQRAGGISILHYPSCFARGDILIFEILAFHT